MEFFLDARLFGAACIGLVALVTSYVAGANGWHLIILPLLVVLGYCLIFPSRDIEQERWSAKPRGRPKIQLK